MENIKAILIPLYNIPQRYKGIILLNLIFTVLVWLCKCSWQKPSLCLLPWKLTSIVSIPR